MNNEQPTRRSPQRSALPWLLAAAALVVYLVTLSHWINVANGGIVMHALGWDHALPYSQPLLHLATLPFRWLPAGWTPILLNALNAVLAALTLMVLARSVMLLPQDRTRDQRMRERGHGALLSIPFAWVPPLLAVLACGLELTFWRNAVSATGEMLDLLLFAVLIYCLLRYRVSKQDRWLYWFAALYGLGTANNYALIGFLPAFCVAFVWIKGMGLFNTRFLLTCFGLGLAGLCLYLVLPLLHALTDLTDLTFWQALNANLVGQKLVPAYFLTGPRYVILVLCLTSVVPMFLFGIRWSSSLGDTSTISIVVRDLMFNVMHLLFFVVCILVAFNPRFSPYEWARRELGIQLPFLTLYYLGALAIGYCAGYLMLVFGRVPSGGPLRPARPLEQIASVVMPGLVWLALIAVPLGLVYTNLTAVRAENSRALNDYATLLVKSLPEGRGVAMSDDPLRLMLARHELVRTGRDAQWLMVDTRFLATAGYNRHLHRAHPDLWPELPNPHPPNGMVDQPWLVQTIAQITTKQPVYYLHPSFGYYFEALYPEPGGLAYRLSLYPKASLTPPPIPAAKIAEGIKFWNDIEPTVLKPLAEQSKESNVNATVAAQYYSRSLTWWGVQLQISGNLRDAGRAFQLATNLNPDNLVAQINGDYNAQLQKSVVNLAELPKSIEDKFGKYRSWDQIMSENGPFDEPRFCFEAAQTFFRGNLIRQAGQQFLRTITLQPEHLGARLMLSQLHLVASKPTNALEVLREVRSKPEVFDLRSNRVELARLEIAARLMTGETNTAERLMAEIHAQGPKDAATLIMLTQARYSQNRFEDALKLNDELLSLNPENADTLLNKSALFIALLRYKDAVPILDQILAKDQKNDKARLNRAISQLKLGNYPEARRDYETLLDSYPNMFNLHYGLGEIGYFTKDRELALKFYRLYLKHAPPGAQEATEVQARVKELEGGE